jgi:Flp pilus assembly CpaE family ATPase
VLLAPEVPDNAPTEPNRLHDILEFVRMLYGWVVLDTPAIPHRTTLLAVSEADEAFVVSTSELASLHLTRRAVNVLEQLGFTRERYRVLINRASKRDGIGSGDMEKVFACPVYQMFPNDYFSLHRVISLGQALANDCELGRTIDKYSMKMVQQAREEGERIGAVAEARTA